MGLPVLIASHPNQLTEDIPSARTSYSLVHTDRLHDQLRWGNMQAHQVDRLVRLNHRLLVGE
jgi:hypothetical protein